MERLSSVCNSWRLARRGAIPLLLLLLGLASLPAAQAQSNKVYVMMWQDDSQVSENPRSRARILVERLPFNGDLGHEAHFRVCASGSATLGVDYNLKMRGKAAPHQSGNCVTGKFPRGWGRVRINIKPIADSIDEPNETITITVSQDSNNHFPAGYSVPSRYAKVSVKLIDND